MSQKIISQDVILWFYFKNKCFELPSSQISSYKYQFAGCIKILIRLKTNFSTINIFVVCFLLIHLIVLNRLRENTQQKWRYL